MRGRFFVSSSSLLNLNLPIHNEALVDDELTTIQLNHQWRRIVTSALYYYFKHGDSSLALDNEDLLDDLLEDVYNAETFTMRAYRPENKDIGANRTTTGTSGSQITGSDISHTFTYPNAVIRCHNIALSNSAAGNLTTAEINVSSEARDSAGNAINEGTASRELVATAEYSGLATGISRTISLFWSVTAGTGTINANSRLLWEIEEWA